MSLLRSALESVIPKDERPVVVYSELFSISRKLVSPVRDQPREIIEALLDLLGPRRTLLLPTYTDGFKDGFLDLDSEPSQTGIISEYFRKIPGVKRTRSAFFSFSAFGPQSKEFTELRFVETYGPGSSYAWIEEHDAHLVSLGVSWDACSLKHRSEWHERVPYRFDKTFEGKLKYEGQTGSHKETLFVRSLDPIAENDWSQVDKILLQGGMKRVPFGGGQVASITTQNLMKQMRLTLKSNPYAFVHNPDLLRAHFG